MSWHELISDLAIIPAWECFLAGVIVGMIVTMVIFTATEGGK